MNRLVTQQVCDKAKWCGVAKVFCLHLLTTPKPILGGRCPFSPDHHSSCHSSHELQTSPVNDQRHSFPPRSTLCVFYLSIWHHRPPHAKPEPGGRPASFPTLNDESLFSSTSQNILNPSQLCLSLDQHHFLPGFIKQSPSWSPYSPIVFHGLYDSFKSWTQPPSLLQIWFLPTSPSFINPLIHSSSKR